MTTVKKVTKARTPSTTRTPRTSKKVTSAPVIAIEAVLEVQVSQVPEAVHAVATIETGAVAPVNTITCEVCTQTKEEKTFVVRSKTPGKNHPEVDVMCQECHEDHVSLQKANNLKAGSFFNLEESRQWDKEQNRLDDLISMKAGRKERGLRCIGAPGEPCGLYHGQFYKGRIQVIITRFFDKKSVKAGDLELIPLPKGACEKHKEVFKQQARDVTPGKIVTFWDGLEMFDLIQGINTWRTNEKARIAAAKESRRLADQEAYSWQLSSDAGFYAKPVTQNDRPASKKQEARFAPSGKTHFGKLEKTEEGRRR